MKIKRKRVLELRKEIYWQDSNIYKSVNSSTILSKANELAKKHNVDIYEFGEARWCLEGIKICVKASKQDYVAFSQELIEAFSTKIKSFSI